MGSIGHPGRIIQGSLRHMSLMTVQALREVSICDDNNPCSTVQALRGYLPLIKLFFCYLVGPRPGLNLVIKHCWPSFPPPLFNIYKKKNFFFFFFFFFFFLFK